jgi:hypothetical protein
MVLLEESADVPEDEPSEFHRLSYTAVKPLLPVEVGELPPKLELNAWVRFENVDATFLYCCTCCDAFDDCCKGASGAPLVAALLFEPPLPDAGTSPSCSTALAIAEASTPAFWVDKSAGAVGNADSLAPFL